VEEGVEAEQKFSGVFETKENVADGNWEQQFVTGVELTLFVTTVDAMAIEVVGKVE
jgi:hypothetical protein